MRVQETEADVSANIGAARFVERLETYRSADELKKIQCYFKTGEGQYGEGDEFIGVRMGQVFALAKEFIEMPPAETEKLLEGIVTLTLSKAAEYSLLTQPAAPFYAVAASSVTSCQIVNR